LALLTPALSEFSFLFDALASISYFAALPLLLITLAATLLKRRSVAICGLLGVGVASAWYISRVDWPGRSNSAAADVSLLFSNIEGKPAAWLRLRKIIEQLEPDLIAIVEAEPAVIQAITADPRLSVTYPYRVMPQQGWNWSQAVLSRHPLTPLGLTSDDTRYRFLFSFHRASVVSLPQGDILLTVEHPPSPRSTEAWRSGNDKINLLGEVCREHFAATGLPVIVAGDFNTSPTGYRDRLLRRSTGLHGDPCAGILYGSWPSFFPQPFRLPLDRVWGSDGVTFISRTVLPDVGSDHSPILVRFTCDSTVEPQSSRE